MRPDLPPRLSADRETGDAWRRAEALWAEALEIPEAERDAWLRERCAADESLRSEVEGLLVAHADVGSRFERVVGEAVAALDEHLPETVAEGPGDRHEDPQDFSDMGLTGLSFGYVEVQGRLGEGGMGRVYWGTDRRLGRKVALKVLRPELASNPRMVSRLEREAQILSQLGHPVICQIHDVIRAPSAIGLVLEFVQGRRLSAAIADGVDTEQALVWATDLADALAQAHDVGIVHRDLKPSNIMVTADGGLKILDFGIARTWSGGADSGELASGSARQDDPMADLTATGEVMGTLLYMSPEQAQGAPISPATDVFSLGLVLFELLSGTPAYSPRRHGEKLFEVVRDGRVPALPGLDADLAELITRLTATAPGSRPSVRDAAERLRWIRGAPGRRRHRRLRAAGVLAVLLFTLAMAWQTYRANRALSLAEQATERANLEAESSMQVADLLVSLLQIADPAMPFPLDAAQSRTAAIEETLRQSVVEMDLGLDQDRELRARLLHDLASVAVSLDVLEVARETAREALDLRRSLHGSDHVAVAESLSQLAEVLLIEGEPEEGLAAARQALAILDGHPQADPGLQISTLASVAATAIEMGHLAEAETASRRDLELALEHWGETSEEVIGARGSLGMVLFTLAKRDNDTAKLAEAKKHFETVRQLEEATYGADHPWFAITLGELAMIAKEEGDLEEAEDLLRRSVEILQGKLGWDSRDTEVMRSRLGSVLRLQGQLEEADQTLRAVVEGIERRLGSDHRDLVASLRRWARVRLDLGDPVGAESKLRWALRLVASLPEGHWERGEVEVDLGSALIDQGRLSEAEEVLRAVLAADRGLPTGLVATEGQRALARLEGLKRRSAEAGVGGAVAP